VLSVSDVYTVLAGEEMRWVMDLLLFSVLNERMSPAASTRH